MRDFSTSLAPTVFTGRRRQPAFDPDEYVYAIHPDHGEPVVFVPGERLPKWLKEAIRADRKDDQGRYLARPPGEPPVPVRRRRSRP